MPAKAPPSPRQGESSPPTSIAALGARQAPSTTLPRTLPVPTTWADVEAHPDGLLALPWDADPIRVQPIARVVTTLTVADLRSTRRTRVQMIPGMGEHRARRLIEYLDGWGLPVGDLADPTPSTRRAETEEEAVARILGNPQTSASVQ